MLTYEEALAKVLALAAPMPATTVPLDDCLGYTLAEPIIAGFDLPSFDNSAVDGYGVRVADVQAASDLSPVQLKMIGESRAGKSSDFDQHDGTAVKILTGAIVPTSAEAVIMREFCEERNGHVIVKASVEAGENIRRKGGEVHRGDTVLAPGIRINPAVLALLATVGSNNARVHQKPRLAIVVTGDELVPPGSELKHGQIFDSNSYGLKAALKCLGISECHVFYAKDTPADTRNAFSAALQCADVVISSGGVSVGDHDYVKDALESLKVETVFWRIAIKPGKPVYFGTLAAENDSAKLVFGLPGNPVSVLVTYHQFVKPALLQMMGGRTVPATKYKAKLTTAIKKKPGRLDFMRGKLHSSETSSLLVTPVKGQDSHMLTGLATADSLLHFAAEAESLPANAEVPIQFLNWFE